MVRRSQKTDQAVDTSRNAAMAHTHTRARARAHTHTHTQSGGEGGQGEGRMRGHFSELIIAESATP